MRLKADIWVKAYLRICQTGGAAVVVVRHGDDDAGAIYIKTRTSDGRCQVYGPAPAGMDRQVSDRAFALHLGATPVDDTEADRYLARQYDFDPDIWVIEVEERRGQSFLDPWLA